MPFTPLFRPVGPVRPTRGRAAGAGGAAAFALALLLGGCAGAPAPSPSGTPSASEAAPIFASDEEALAAAEAAYERYLSVSSAVSTEGGKDPSRIREVVTEEYATELVREFESMHANSLRIEGTNTLDTTSLVERSESAATAFVSIYGCVGVGSTRVIDGSGQDVTPVDRDDRVPVVISLETRAADGVTLVAGTEPWSGDDFC